MVDYTLVLELGSSNAAPLGDIQGWEDAHPELAVRSPGIDRSRAKQVSAGSYRDDFTLAATFKGGPQSDVYGTTINGTWQTVNLRGVASDAVRVATFYNPSSTLQTPTAHARNVPGTYSVVAATSETQPNKGVEFATNFIVQAGRMASDNAAKISAVSGTAGNQTLTTAEAHGLVVNDIVVFKLLNSMNVAVDDGPYKITNVGSTTTFKMSKWPSGTSVAELVLGSSRQARVYKVNNTASPFLITRKRTGSTHTYAPTGLGSDYGGRLVVDPPFTPAPDDNEEFTVDLRLQRAPADANDPLVLDAYLGGFVRNNPALSAVSTLRTSTSSSFKMLHSPKQPLRQGRAFTLDTSASASWPYTAALPDKMQLLTKGTPDGGSPNTGTDDEWYVVNEHSLANWLTVGDAVVVHDLGDLFPSDEWNDGQTYYIKTVNSTSSASTSYIQLAATPGGTAISYTIDGTPETMGISPYKETRYPIRQPVALVPAAHTATQGTSDRLTVAVDQEFCVGERIKISYATGDGPTNATAGSDYYVKAVDSATTPGAELLTLTTNSNTSAGSALSITWGGQAPIVERLDAYSTWLFASTRDGAEVTTTTHSLTTLTWTDADRFAGSIAGLRIRCTSGANVGQWKHGKHVSYDSSTGLTQVHFDGDWSSTPTVDDVFVIEPTPVGSDDRPYEKFCQLLPWAPFEGRARGSVEAGLSTVTIAHGTTTSAITAVGLSAPDRSAVKFYTTGTLPNGLTPGKTYYVSKGSGTSAEITTTYGGTSAMQTSASGSGTHYAEVVDNDNGFNPHPPGFNYPGQFSIPRRYMPFDGYVQGSFYGEQTSQQSAGISAGMQLAFDLHSHTGRRSLYAPLAFEKTTLKHREVHADGTGAVFGWSDLNQQLSWAPGETNGCFARLLDMLDGIKLALTEESSTIADVVVHFNQGEEDAGVEYLANNYRKNLHQFKAAVRQALYDRGLSPVKPERIKWLQATIPTDVPPRSDQSTTTRWPYASTVNTAIEAEALADDYSRSLTGTDLESHADRTVFSDNAAADEEHYHGTQMDLLGQRAFTAFKALERSGYSETEVCNMALSYLGEPGRLTNVDTDTSREAELCRQFLAVARDELLERHAWDFALRSVSPTKRTASPRVDYKYAYDYPDNVASVLSLVRSDVDYNYKTMGTTGQHDYTVELDDNGDRVLLTDLNDALMLYVAKVTDPTKWSTVFTSALAWRLVFHLAGAILKGEEGSKKAAAAAQMAENVLRTATKHDSDHKRDVDISNHVPVFLRHRSNPGNYRR